MKKLPAKYAGVIASLALLITATSANMNCWLIMHQPKMPEGAEKLRKF
ncbi:MAG TPA: cyclic lactone autoinducer peptide [Bacillota bacterium]|nr:cyclic lactone autoinducer peptide [Bacillota bacterium]